MSSTEKPVYFTLARTTAAKKHDMMHHIEEDTQTRREIYDLKAQIEELRRAAASQEIPDIRKSELDYKMLNH
jgi:cell division protein FtsL